MEKVSVGIRLPPGFRFHPTDEELVVEYLKRKAYSFPLPASIIPDLDVCKSDPWDLPGDSGQERYFFSRREAKYPNGNRSNRATLSGYWKATGKDKAILLRNNNNIVVVVGMKKTLVFYRGKPPHGSRTDWIMHEYRLPHSSGPQAKADWVLCRIFLKKRNNSATRNIVEDEQEDQQEVICDDHNQVCTIINTDTNNGRRNVKPVFYDFLGAHLNHPAPSSDSSAVTQLSSNTNDDSESTSCCNTSSFNTAKPSHPPS